MKQGEANSLPFSVGSLLKKLFGVRKEISANRANYFCLLIILVGSAFLRLYRLDQLLGFWYDQGRDALVIWDLLHYRKFFLIGPVTGIEGIFLGPFYYYLLAPLYFLGRGSPVFVAAGLAWLTVAAIFLIYYLGSEVYNKKVGLLAAFLYGFSYEFIIFSRWLANPNPLPFFALATTVFLLKAIERKPTYLIWASLFLGLCLQLEAASAIFFLPATLVIIFWQRKKLLKPKLLLCSCGTFFITLLPQLIFNFRHQGILFQAFKKFLVVEKSFQPSVWETIKLRIPLYYNVFLGKLFPFNYLKLFCLTLFLATGAVYRKEILSQRGKLLAIWLISPLIGFLFYKGNYGYIWDYYFTGVQPVFIILFSAGIFYLVDKRPLLKVLLGVFLISFLLFNFKSLRNYYQAGIGITLRAQAWVIDWIYQDAGDEDFNVDVYVPPQIYFSYSYLFRWYGKGKYGREPNTKLVRNLYTLYEPDSEHPQFLDSWLKRQAGIGKIVKSESWGDITVQKRERLVYE
jgi:4-amino-4-deoxy-L-arabinose transferase-like glycosyltransferase